MDTADIEVFLVLAEELHFGRTAERLRLTQPRVSRVVAALERQAAGRLFARTSRRVRLTPLGARLREQLQPAYAQFQAAFEDARRAAQDANGVLRIGYTATTYGEALTRLVRAFEAENPGCQVLLHEVGIWDPYASLRSGRADVLVNWLAVDEPDLTAGPAIECRDRFLAVAATHPLAQRRSVSVEDLGDYAVEDPPPSLPAVLRDAILPRYTPAGRPIRRVQVSACVSEMLHEIIRGRIVHPTMHGVQMLRRDDIALIPIEGLLPLPLGLIWCTAHENARIRALADTARQFTSRTPGGGAYARHLRQTGDGPDG